MVEPIPFHTVPRTSTTRVLTHYEQCYRSLVELISDAVLILDLKGVCLESNQRAADLFSFPGKTLVGVSLMSLVPEYERAELKQTFAQLQLIAGVKPASQRYLFLAYDGRRMPSEVSIVLVCDDDGRPFQFQCVVHTIVERRSTLDHPTTQQAPSAIEQEINSTLDLKTLLDLILDHLVELMPYERADILLLDEQSGSEKVWLAQRRGRGAASLRSSDDRVLFSITESPALRQMHDTNAPLLLGRDGAELLGLRLHDARLQAHIGVPICGAEQTIGFLVVSSTIADSYQSSHVEQLQLLGGQVATALHNAMFFQQTQQLATLEERQRLARELHDAVSQTLFSANIFVEMMPRLRQRNPEEAWKHFPQLQRLVRGALGEMRSLLHELRPSSLELADLATLLGHLIDAVGARTESVVTLVIGNVPMLPIDVKIAFYRIAQEALNNAIKHATAAHVTISLQLVGDDLQLCVADDGIGFERDQSDKGQLGMGIIRERAAAIGATLELQAVPGRGVEVTLSYRVPSADEEIDDDDA
jgi:PAS domain S-box-containing protein